MPIRNSWLGKQSRAKVFLNALLLVGVFIQCRRVGEGDHFGLAHKKAPNLGASVVFWFKRDLWSYV
jgi:hypothetical protein